MTTTVVSMRATPTPTPTATQSQSQSSSQELHGGKAPGSSASTVSEQVKSQDNLMDNLLTSSPPAPPPAPPPPPAEEGPCSGEETSSPVRTPRDPGEGGQPASTSVAKGGSSTIAGAGGANNNSGKNQGRKGTPWTEAEHVAFLDGLKVLGKGNWRGISKKFVPTRTPTQVASHAQKHFLRVTGATKRKSRFTALEQAFNQSYSANIYNLDTHKRKSSFDEGGSASQEVKREGACLPESYPGTSVLGTSPPQGTFNPYLANPFMLMASQQQALYGASPASPLELQLMLQQAAASQQQMNLTQQAAMAQNPMAFMQAMALLSTMPQFSGGLGARSLSSNDLTSTLTKSASAPNLNQLGGGQSSTTNSNNLESGHVFKPVPSRPSATLGTAGFAPGILGSLNQVDGHHMMLAHQNQIIKPVGSLKNVNSTPSLPSMVQQGQQSAGFQASGGQGFQNPLQAPALNSIMEKPPSDQDNE